MRALLMYPDRDFDLKQELLLQESDLVKDLELDTLFDAMAEKDEFLLAAARTALLSSLKNDIDTILYRQAILADCIRNQTLVRELYGLTLEAEKAKRGSYFGIFVRSPGSVLSTSVDLLRILAEIVGKLKGFADRYGDRFESKGFTVLLTMLQKEFSDEYLAEVQNHLTELKFKSGVLVSAELGNGNQGIRHVLRHLQDKTPIWIKRILGRRPVGYTFHIHPRDEAGGRILSELRDRGINMAANAVAQATEHIVSFFEMLRTELAFYLGCLNLHGRLAAREGSICFPIPAPAGHRVLRFNGLYDVSLSFHSDRSVVGNTVDAEGKNIIIVTGANRGGKSTFLRSIGLAQVMMQSGMFVGARSFTGELCAGLLTHYIREEDAAMEKGKLDEELSRMSRIADIIFPQTMMLFNESFGATNEREGSEIARQIVRALLEKDVKVFFVTHLYEFARGLWEDKMDDALFLRAERLPDGQRTFKLATGEPFQTSFGVDLYEQIFSYLAAKK